MAAARAFEIPKSSPVVLDTCFLSQDHDGNRLFALFLRKRFNKEVNFFGKIFRELALLATAISLLLCLPAYGGTTAPSFNFNSVAFGLDAAVLAQNNMMGDPPLPHLFMDGSFAKVGIQPAYVSGSINTDDNGSKLRGSFLGGGVSLTTSFALSKSWAFYIMGMGADPGSADRISTRPHSEVLDEERYLDARCYGRNRDITFTKRATVAHLGQVASRDTPPVRISDGAQPMK